MGSGNYLGGINSAKISNEKIDVNDVIEISFGSEKQADGIKGICFSLGNST